MAEKKPKVGDVIGKIAGAAKKAADLADGAEKKKTTPKRTTVAANTSQKKKTGTAKKTSSAKKETTAFDDYVDITKNITKDSKELTEGLRDVFSSSEDCSDNAFGADNKNEKKSILNVVELAGDVVKSGKKTKSKARKAKKKLKKSSKIQIAIITIAAVLALSVFMVYVISPDSFYRAVDAVYTLFSDDGYGKDYEMFYNEDGSVEVYFIDVGQGDSIFIRFSNGQTMLIDGGENRASVERSIKTALDQMNVKFIDYLMLTHTDSDHVGSMDFIVKNYEIGAFYVPGVRPSYKDASADKDKIDGTISTAAYYSFYNAALNETYTKDGKSEKSVIDKNIGTMTILESGSLKLTAYCPDEQYYKEINNKSSAEMKNNMSPICILEFAGKKICLTGDADEAAEERFIRDAGNKIDVDVLKAGHHGSRTSTNAKFYDFITPEYSVISVGANNKYGHPSKEVLDRFTAENDTVYRTDKNGTIKLTVSGSGEIKFDTVKAA